jgi:hypothetical protein
MPVAAARTKPTAIATMAKSLPEAYRAAAVNGALDYSRGPTGAKSIPVPPGEWGLSASGLLTATASAGRAPPSRPWEVRGWLSNPLATSEEPCFCRLLATITLGKAPARLRASTPDREPVERIVRARFALIRPKSGRGGAAHRRSVDLASPNVNLASKRKDRPPRRRRAGESGPPAPRPRGSRLRGSSGSRLRGSSGPRLPGPRLPDSPAPRRPSGSSGSPAPRLPDRLIALARSSPVVGPPSAPEICGRLRLRVDYWWEAGGCANRELARRRCR